MSDYAQYVCVWLNHVQYARYNPANSLTIDKNKMIENENCKENGIAASARRCEHIGLSKVVQNSLKGQNHGQEINYR